MPVVEGTGAMTGGVPTKQQNVEQAMIEAIKKAQTEGITDPDIIRERIWQAITEATGG